MAKIGWGGGFAEFHAAGILCVATLICIIGW